MFRMEREIIREFIEAYQQHPCLWRVLDDKYRDKVARNAALKQLVPIINKVEGNGSIAMVKRRIQSLRNSFRKEQRKVLDAKKAGTVHKPLLWYYHKLLFIKREPPKRSSSIIDDCLEEKEQGNSHDSLVYNSYDRPVSPSGSSGSTRNHVPTQVPPQGQQPSEPMLHYSLQPSSVQQASEPIADNSLQQGSEQAPLALHDCLTAFGHYVAEKLNALSPHQAVFAQKFIGDILFYGELNQLGTGTTITNPPAMPFFNLST